MFNQVGRNIFILFSTDSSMKIMLNC